MYMYCIYKIAILSSLPSFVNLSSQSHQVWCACVPLVILVSFESVVIQLIASSPLTCWTHQSSPKHQLDINQQICDPLPGGRRGRRGRKRKYVKVIHKFFNFHSPGSQRSRRNWKPAQTFQAGDQAPSQTQSYQYQQDLRINKEGIN